MAAEKLSTEIRREQIARAAVDLVAEKGLSGLNMADLAERVGLVPSAIYRHFKGKDEVLDAVFDFMRESLEEIVDSSLADGRDALDALRLLLERHERLVLENPGMPRIIFSQDVADRSPELRRKFRSIIEGYLERIAGVIRQGRKEKTIRADLDPEVGAMAFIGVIQPAIVRWHLSDHEFDIQNHIKKAWLVFRRAVAAR